METTIAKGRQRAVAAVLAVSNVGALLTALNCVSDLRPDDKITIKRGCALTLLGLVYFTTLFELLNTLALGSGLRHKYRLSCGDVLDVNNKLVSAVQALFCCLTGAVVLRWSCARDVARASHFVSEAYAWFGAAYFFYDIWSMYTVHVNMMAGDVKGKPRKPKNGALATAPAKQSPTFLQYCTHEPVILFHHLFIGGFGFLVIVYLRGGLGDCVFGFVYLMELSTPFVSVRGILSRLKLKASRAYVLNGILMLLTFLFCRVLSLPYVCYMYSKVIGLSYFEVLALPTEPQYVPADFIENVLQAEVEADPAGSRIVSGWEAYPGQHPHQVSLRMVNAVGDVSSCGGSVVHRNWVISAAHCTALRISLVIRAGVTHLTRPDHLSESTVWFNYPTYNDNLPGLVQPDDIAIIELTKPITFNHLVQPIRIQSSADAFRNYQGEVVIASGFGRTWTLGTTPETLNWVYLRAVANPSCATTFGSIITANAICAQFYNVTSQSTCQGDSGGPLVHVDSAGVPILIGVASFVAGGDWGCHSGLPAGFIRAGPFHSWYTQVTGLDFENLEEEETTETPTTTTTEAPVTTEAPTTTEAPEPPTTTEAPEPPTTTEAPTTPESPDSKEEEDSTEEPGGGESEEKDSSESDDCELSELLKKLEVKVSVKVKLSKYKKKN